jgi:hypothetical protein
MEVKKLVGVSCRKYIRSGETLFMVIVNVPGEVMMNEISM